jgi:hypothetical protein
MTSSSPPRISFWERSCSTLPDQAFASGLAFILAVAAEFGRAAAAAHRYERLRRRAGACDHPDASPARRIYTQFYSDG